MGISGNMPLFLDKNQVYSNLLLLFFFVLKNFKLIKYPLRILSQTRATKFFLDFFFIYLAGLDHHSNYIPMWIKIS